MKTRIVTAARIIAVVSVTLALPTSIAFSKTTPPYSGTRHACGSTSIAVCGSAQPTAVRRRATELVTPFRIHRSALATADENENEAAEVEFEVGDGAGGSGGSDDYSFFDEASIYVRAGSGGQGSSTYKKAKKSSDGIPDGGSGGTGGDVVMTVDPSLNTLAGLSRRSLRPNAFGGGGGAASSKGGKRRSIRERLVSFRADDGAPGGRMYDNGRGGEDCEVRVPPGTVVSVEAERVEYDGDGDVVERGDGEEVQYDLHELGTVTLDESSLVVARGGAGGEGTATLRGKKKGATRRGPIGGVRHRLRLTLKIVADVALVGVPNAGKSTFLSVVTRAKPRIADYPFTTVVPNLGVWIPGSADLAAEDRRRQEGRIEDRAAGSTGLVLCDVPGLIEGAADGAGLGHAFLRHVERCRVILHLIDGTSEDPVGDFRMVNEEIRKYGTGSLSKMPQVVVVNKVDTWAEDSEEEQNARKEALAEKLKAAMGHTRVLFVSAKGRDGVDDLMTRMAAYVDKVMDPVR